MSDRPKSGTRCPCCGQPLLDRLESFVTREEAVEILHARGIAVTTQQLRYWAQIGKIPRPLSRKRHLDTAAVALYAPEDLDAIYDYGWYVLHPSKKWAVNQTPSWKP